MLFICSVIPALIACASSSQVLVGAPRAPITAAQVRIYTQAPKDFEEIAVLGASRKSVAGDGGEKAIEKMIESMRAQAAQLGANGLLLEEFSDSEPVEVATSVASQTYTHNASINVGVAGSVGVVKMVTTPSARYDFLARCQVITRVAFFAGTTSMTLFHTGF